jgi:CDP-diglyceride synthetase
MDQAPIPTTSSKMQTFWRRLLSSVLLWSMVIGALFTERLFSDIAFLVVILLIAGFGLQEFYELCEKRNLVTFNIWGMIAACGLMVSSWVYLSGYFVASKSPAQANSFETSILIIFVLGLCVRQFLSRSNTMGILAISTTLFGIMYVRGCSISSRRSITIRLCTRNRGISTYFTSSPSPSSVTWARTPLVR